MREVRYEDFLAIFAAGVPKYTKVTKLRMPFKINCELERES
jgi:hypothetical protein